MQVACPVAKWHDGSRYYKACRRASTLLGSKSMLIFRHAAADLHQPAAPGSAYESAGATHEAQKLTSVTHAPVQYHRIQCSNGQYIQFKMTRWQQQCTRVTHPGARACSGRPCSCNSLCIAGTSREGLTWTGSSQHSGTPRTWSTQHKACSHVVSLVEKDRLLATCQHGMT